MRLVSSTNKVTIKVNKDELIGDKWLNFTLLSQKLKTIEEQGNKPYKAYRSRLYNSWNSNKYNTSLIAGIRCIDIDDPMRAVASLELNFERS